MAKANGRVQRPAQSKGGPRSAAVPTRPTRPGPPSSPSDRDHGSIVAEVGIRLKQLRTDAGLTLDALSKSAGVSRAMLSKVERGEKSPTLTVFVRIATGLGVSLSKLMGAASDVAETAIVRADQRLTFQDPETGFERHILSPNHIDNGIELLLHRIPPGQSSGLLPVYNVPTEKLLVVHEGRLTVYAGESRYDLNSGDSFYFEVRKPYRFVNLEKTWCSYYLVVSQRR